MSQVKVTNLPTALRSMDESGRSTYINELEISPSGLDGCYLGFALEYLSTDDQTALIRKITDEQWKKLLNSAYSLNIMLIHLTNNPEMRGYLISKINPNTFNLDGVTLALALSKLEQAERIELLNQFTQEQLHPALKNSTDILFISSVLEKNTELQARMLSILNKSNSPFTPSSNPDHDTFLLKAAAYHITDPQNKQSFLDFICTKISSLVEAIKAIFSKEQEDTPEQIESVSRTSQWVVQTFFSERLNEQVVTPETAANCP